MLKGRKCGGGKTKIISSKCDKSINKSDILPIEGEDEQEGSFEPAPEIPNGANLEVVIRYINNILAMVFCNGAEIKDLRALMAKGAEEVERIATWIEEQYPHSEAEELEPDYSTELTRGWQLLAEEARKREEQAVQQAEIKAQLDRLVDDMRTLKDQAALERQDPIPHSGDRTPEGLTFKIRMPWRLIHGHNLVQEAEQAIFHALHVRVTVTQAFYLRTAANSPCRMMIKVAEVRHADAITRNRWKLKNTQLTILDELTQEEMTTHKLLWGKFSEARRAGKQAWFVRARLYVEREEVIS
jgi:hypothetical protein